MPAPAAPLYSSPYPALYLYPLNDSFIPKHIALSHNQHVKIGRQTNAKTTPGERNGYFDSKVLSRQHAEIWEEGNKIFIKDVKSSNGTFINGERLSPEGLESDPYELKSDDIVEFGIDIVGEDNKTIVHHKVAARVVCIFTEQDAQMAARAEQHQMQQMQQFAGPSSTISPGPAGSMMNQAGPSSGPGSANSSSFNFSGQQPPRRPQMSQQGISGMGGMGGSMRPPGKSGLTFDHILNRLQGELQKSRETGAELHTLTGAMNEIHDTLGGGNLPATAPFPHTLPPVRQQPPSHSPPTQSEGPAAAIVPPTHAGQEPSSNEPMTASTTASNIPPASSSTLLADLQTQLQETQTHLSQHIDKIRVLEDALKEQEVIRHEVRLLRDMMDTVQRRPNGDSQDNKPRRMSALEPRGGFDIDEEEEGDSMEDDFDDDSRSVGTVVPHELERVEEEDEESAMAADDEAPRGRVDELDLEIAGDSVAAAGEAQQVEFEREDSEAEEERRERRQELGRPRTPEPSNLGMGGRDREGYEPRSRSKTLTSPSPKLSQPSSNVVDELTTRLTTLSSQLESALALSSTLQTQHSSAQSTISALESKVEALENLVTATLSAQQRQPAPQQVTPELSEPAVSQSASASASAERESLTSMVMEWKKSVEGQWSNVQEEWIQERERLSRAREEWESKVRLVDDGLERMERMEKVALSKDVPLFHGNGDIKHGLVTPPSPRSLSSDSNRPRRKRSGSGRGRTGSRKRSLSRGADTDDTEATLASEEPHSIFEKAAAKLSGAARTHSPDHHRDEAGVRSLATPEPSVHASSNGGGTLNELVSSSGSHPSKGQASNDLKNGMNMQTAVGVLVLSVAAAAVVWRVKPDNV